jgi:hypothetical protein
VWSALYIHSIQESAAFKQPAMREPRSRSRRSSRPSSRRGSVSSVISLPGMRRSSLADEDIEMFFPERLTTKNLPPCARRALNRSTYERSSSVPPSPPSRQASGMTSTAYKSSGGGLIDLGSPLFRVVDGGPVVKPAYMSTYARSNESKSKYRQTPNEEVFRKPVPMAKRRYSFAFEDPDEFRRHYNYTPQLRTAHAYEFTSPRPFVRRHVPLQMPTLQTHIYRGEVFKQCCSGALQCMLCFQITSLLLNQHIGQYVWVTSDLLNASTTFHVFVPFPKDLFIGIIHVFVCGCI